MRSIDPKMSIELVAPDHPVPVTACMVMRANNSIWGITTGKPRITISVLEFAPFIEIEAIKLKDAEKEKLAKAIVTAKRETTSNGELKITVYKPHVIKPNPDRTRVL